MKKGKKIKKKGKGGGTDQAAKDGADFVDPDPDLIRG